MNKTEQEYQVGVTSNLYQAGTDEEGQPYIAEVYSVVVEFLDGQRLEHRDAFCGAKVVQDEDGFGFEDIREEAKGRAEDLATLIRETGDLSECDPARSLYGSDSY